MVVVVITVVFVIFIVTIIIPRAVTGLVVPITLVMPKNVAPVRAFKSRNPSGNPNRSHVQSAGRPSRQLSRQYWHFSEFLLSITICSLAPKSHWFARENSINVSFFIFFIQYKLLLIINFITTGAIKRFEK